MSGPSQGAGLLEADVQRTVTDALTKLGWRWTHFRPAIDRSGRWTTPLSGHKGWPDIFACRGDEAIAIECKSQKGKTSADQDAWLSALGAAGVACFVVKPSGLERFLEVLR